MSEAQWVWGDFLVGPEEKWTGHRGSGVEGCTRLGNQSRPEDAGKQSRIEDAGNQSRSEGCR